MTTIAMPNVQPHPATPDSEPIILYELGMLVGSGSGAQTRLTMSCDGRPTGLEPVSPRSQRGALTLELQPPDIPARPWPVKKCKRECAGRDYPKVTSTSPARPACDSIRTSRNLPIRSRCVRACSDRPVETNRPSPATASGSMS